MNEKGEVKFKTEYRKQYIDTGNMGGGGDHEKEERHGIRPQCETSICIFKKVDLSKLNL